MLRLPHFVFVFVILVSEERAHPGSITAVTDKILDPPDLPANATHSVAGGGGQASQNDDIDL